MKSVLLCLCAAVALSACGKKGNPLPPLVRIPAAPAEFGVTRLDDHVLVRVAAPASNIDGAQPVDLGRVEIYAMTLPGAAPDLSQIDPEEFREASTLVAELPQSAMTGTVVVREPITGETHMPAALPPPRVRVLEDTDAPRPLVAPLTGTALHRYYYAVAANPRGRYGPPTALLPVPLGRPSGPPSAPSIAVGENSATLRWTPPADAKGAANDPELLPATPIMPPPPPTTYDVYEVPRNASPDRPLAFPAALTPEPIAATEFTLENITLGTERCFAVRAVDVIDGVHVRGPASPAACSPFADTFAPDAPRELVAVAVAGGVNLIWEPSGSKDVAGYLVLRGAAGGATLTALNKDPVRTPSYRDESVTSGVRYVYTVVAVDAAGNRSEESNRVEETAQ